MIYESAPWKRDLLVDAQILKRWAKKPHWQRAHYIFEKKVFFAAYAIRKLIHAGKIGPDFPFWGRKVKKYENRNRSKIDMFNRDRLEQHYDFENFKAETLSLEHLCNQIVHSYIFSFCHSEDGSRLQGIWFVSDKDKNELLYYIELNEFLEMMIKVGTSDVWSSIYTRIGNNPEKTVSKKKDKYSLGFEIKSKYGFNPS